MENFKDILTDLIAETGKSVNQISKESSIDNSLFADYLNGAIPSIKVAVRIAVYFNCSLDYLFGLSATNKKVDYKNFKFDVNTFLKRYEQLLKENNVSHYIFSRDAGFSESLRRKWRKGDFPSTKTLILIAKNLYCSLDFLIGK